MREWCRYLVLGGDLNETRTESLDRKRMGKAGLEEKPKFISILGEQSGYRCMADLIPIQARIYIQK